MHDNKDLHSEQSLKAHEQDVLKPFNRGAVVNICDGSEYVSLWNKGQSGTAAPSKDQNAELSVQK